MAHRCVRCGKIYESTAQEILKGCSCGSHYFFFFREQDTRALEETEKLTRHEREEIVKDVDEIVGEDIEKPIILNIESIRVKKPGKFELDLVNILKRRPIVYKVEEGKYIIDIPSTFQLRKHLKEKEREINDIVDEDLEDKEHLGEIKEEVETDQPM
ncbi:MAG: hypothetical protein JSW08_00160 [archaeon]|nr:MAG: hypothetical protein JSW08_00160 [archaeon]